MIIADSTTWINHLKGIKSKETEAFEFHLYNEEVFLIPLIIQEVLQGFRHPEQAKKLENEMLKMFILKIEDQVTTAIECAHLYQNIRAKGVTIRKTQDIIIAYHCLYFNVPLLHSDKDFDNLAQKTALKIYKV